jgi:integrase/recombinase XerD
MGRNGINKKENRSLAPYQFSLDSAIAEWIAQKKIRTGSAKTEQAYHDTMRSFRTFLAKGNLDLLDSSIDVARVATIWASLRNEKTRRPGQDVSPSTYNLRLAILSSFYTFLNENYKLDPPVPNPIETVKKRPVQAYAAALPLDAESLEKLATIDRTTREGLRDYALIAVALATGRRASELVGLRWEHVRITGKREKRVTLTFAHCKGNKVMRDMLDEETSAIFLEYLHTHYGKNVMQLQGDAPIWVSYSNRNQGKAISAKTLSNVCLEVLDTGKVHTLRHTFAVGMIRAGAPITDLASRLGHTDIKITQAYTKEIMGDDNPYSEKLTARFGLKRYRSK